MTPRIDEKTKIDRDGVIRGIGWGREYIQGLLYFKEHFENLVLTPVEVAQILVLLNIMRDKAYESLK